MASEPGPTIAGGEPNAGSGAFGSRFTDGVEEALRWAVASAEQRKADVTAHHVFMGVLLRAHDESRADAGQVVYTALKQQLVERRIELNPVAWFERANGHSLETRPKKPALRFSPRMLDASGRKLMERAFHAADVTGKDDTIHLRHLIGGAFADPFELGLMGEKGIEFGAVVDAFWRAVIAPYPKEADFWTGLLGPFRSSSAQADAPEPPPRLSLGHQMERHAFLALQTAIPFAEGGSIHPVHVLRAIASFHADDKLSSAFNQLRSLVKLPHEPTPRLGIFTGIALEPRLDRVLSFSLEKFHDSGGTGVHRNPLWGRELIAAVLLAGDDELDAYLRKCGSSLMQLRDAWYDFVVGENRGLTRAQWDEWWAFASELAAKAATETKPVTPDTAPGSTTTWDRPHIDSDRVAGAIAEDQDLLDAKLPARRFAKLLAARKPDPPIAVGLFGNWGSGKSFFMGLMQGHIKSLQNSSDAYARRVAQIDFNAWHYHDTNLWASLALRIFDGLAKELGGEKETEVEARRRELHQKMESSKARRIEAEARRNGALERRAEAAKTLEETRAAREKLSRESVSLRFKAAGAVASKLPSFKTLQAMAVSLANQFGIPQVMKTADDVDKLKSAISATANRGHGLYAALVHRFSGAGPAAATVTVLVLLGLVVLAFGWGMDRLKIPSPSTSLIQVAALLSTGVAWCSKRVKELQNALDLVTKVEADLTAEEQKLLSTPAMAELTERIAYLDKAIHEATEQATAAEREIADATAEIGHIDNGGMVYDFLQERQRSASYLGQVGLISTIREDFKKLKDLLRDFVDHGKNPIDRVVLYIDDLDRCHPDKVVEVLQAVHLLLAFDLFNVVVGVDARWLERSLRRKYITGIRNGPDAGEFSPQDYLEKIFQIPYMLAPLSEGEYRDLIAGMVETRTDWQKKQAREQEEKQQKLERKKREEQQRQEAEKAKDKALIEMILSGPAVAGNGAGAAPPDTATPTDGPARNTGSSRATTPDPTEGPGDKPQAADKEAEPALVFEDHEESFMQQLHAFVDRPRLAKRLLNIYRLLRVRAAEEKDGEAFLSTSRYRAVLTLLAINVGHPRIAPKVLRAIESSDPDAKRTLVDLLGGLGAAKDHSLSWSASERTEIAYIIGKLRQIKDSDLGDLEAYRTWAPRVARYSFDWYREPPADERTTAN